MRWAQPDEEHWLSTGCAALFPAAPVASRAGTRDRDPRCSRARCRRACRNRPRRCFTARRAPSPSSHIGTPYCAVICCQPSAMARSTMSSATSVRRSLTFITGRRPVRSATATRKIAARWNWRSVSTWRSGSSSGSCSIITSSSAERLARAGSEAGGARPPAHRAAGVGCDLCSEEIAVAAQLDQARGRRALMQQREVRRAGRWPR